MKEEGLIQKRQKEVQSKIDENKNSTSPEFVKEDSFINLSPDKSLNNQKYSPSKGNFFGIKSSPTHTKENQLKTIYIHQKIILPTNIIPSN